MGMTLTEKILAAHAGKEYVEPGEIIEAKLDLCLANDITAPLSLEEFDRVGAKKVFDPEKVVFALFVGILFGTYSSVFNASPIVYDLLGGDKQVKEAEAKEALSKDVKKK